jgi:hypothetical protein
MGMSAAERLLTLSMWVGPSSDSEKVQQDRAERMVRDAIAASSAFDESSVLIYTKGSYPNNTNVRRDSDVDVVVELQDCLFYDYFHDPAARSSGAPYSGGWTPASWRKAVQEALVNQFGSDAIDPGNIALNVAAVAGSRPSADVVPSFAYERYDDPQEWSSHRGSCVFPADGGLKVVNWPAQQLANGQALNRATGQRYKKYVRALKNAENTLVAEDVIKDLPSYFMECLVYNVPHTVLTQGSLDEGFAGTLQNLYQRLDDGTALDEFQEPNELKWLFKGQSKWSVDDAVGLVAATWTYLGYGD